MMVPLAALVYKANIWNVQYSLGVNTHEHYRINATRYAKIENVGTNYTVSHNK